VNVPCALSQITCADTRCIEVYCDASDSGCGGHLTLCSEDEQTEFWNKFESQNTLLGGNLKL
jgi:hypothetical protein